jgi:hypothetical protein
MVHAGNNTGKMEKFILSLKTFIKTQNERDDFKFG